MLKIEKTNCKAKHKYSHIRQYYILDDNKDIIDYMNENNWS